MNEITARLTAAATPSAPSLFLRPWSPEDVPALVGCGEDAELRRRTTFAVNDEADADRWIRDSERGWQDGNRFAFAVLEVEEDGGAGQLAGHVVLKGVTPGSSTAEVGYWTAARARGRGVAPRAVAAVTEWAFATFGEGGVEGAVEGGGLKTLELLHQVDNVNSCRVAEKSGYTLRAILPASPPAYPHDGHLHVLER
jgi:RimJ/RimL family protein N-acetyltransferase